MNNNKKTLIYFYVKVGRSYGFGHLNRSLNLSCSLDKYLVHFFIDGDEKASSILTLRNISFDIVRTKKDIIFYLKKNKPSLMICDIRDSSYSFMRKLRSFSPIISLDDFGCGQVWSTVTINALPIPKSMSPIKANFEGRKYLILDSMLPLYKKKYSKEYSYSVGARKDKPTLLVSFGGEDPFSLTSFAYDILSEIKERTKFSFDIKIILGPLYKGRRNFPHASLIETLSPEHFYKELARSSLVLTSFGMTLYEALFFDKIVYTINPTDYHNELANLHNDIINIGTARKTNKIIIKNTLFKYINASLEEYYTKKDFIKNTAPITEKKIFGTSNVLSIIDKLLSRKEDLCPVCRDYAPVYKRDIWINYYHCINCHSFFRSYSYSCKEEYKDDYFTDQYKAQYGRTYLDDRDNINKLNKERLKFIHKLAYKPASYHNKASKLLEIGSAMGFFLEEARKEGYLPCGVEISSYGTSYAINELKLSVLQGDFTKVSLRSLALLGRKDEQGKNKEINKERKDEENKQDLYDIICAWYFIEHNKDFISVLKKIRKLLREGGLLCLSTPNSYGLSFKRSKREYINKIPLDHYIEFSPKSLSMLLSTLGFRVHRVVIKGLHLSRFIKNKHLRAFAGFAKKIILYVLKKRRLGDTFEIYASKKTKKTTTTLT